MCKIVKNVLLINLIIILFISCSNPFGEVNLQEPERLISSRVEYFSNNEIHQTELYEYNDDRKIIRYARTTNTISNKSYSAEITYEYSGKSEIRSSYNSDGNRTDKVVYTYIDSSMTKIDYIEKYDAESNFTNLQAYYNIIYDDNVRISRKEYINFNDNNSNFTYSYTYNNKAQTMIAMDSLGEITGKFVILYTDYNFDTVERYDIYNSNDDVVRSEIYEYNSDGNVTLGKIIYHFDSSSSKLATLTYNEDGNLIYKEEKYIEDDNIICTTDYTYYSDGRLKQIDTFEPGLPDFYTTETYTYDGNMETMIKYSNGTQSTKVETTYL